MVQVEDELQQRWKDPGQVGVQHVPTRTGLAHGLCSAIVCRRRQALCRTLQQLEVMTVHPAIEASSNLACIAFTADRCHRLFWSVRSERTIRPEVALSCDGAHALRKQQCTKQDKELRLAMGWVRAVASASRYSSGQAGS